MSWEKILKNRYGTVREVAEEIGNVLIGYQNEDQFSTFRLLEAYPNQRVVDIYDSVEHFPTLMVYRITVSVRDNKERGNYVGTIFKTGLNQNKEEIDEFMSLVQLLSFKDSLFEARDIVNGRYDEEV
jgi:hypothetical protein